MDIPAAITSIGRVKKCSNKRAEKDTSSSAENSIELISSDWIRGLVGGKKKSAPASRARITNKRSLWFIGIQFPGGQILAGRRVPMLLVLSGGG